MKRLILLAAWAAIGFIAYATLVPLSARPHLGSDPNDERFLAFAVAGGLLMLAYPRHVFRVIAFTIAMAVGLEVLQHYAVDRHAGTLDTVVKAAGAICGILVARLGVWVLRPRPYRESPRR